MELIKFESETQVYLSSSNVPIKHLHRGTRMFYDLEKIGFVL